MHKRNNSENYNGKKIQNGGPNLMCFFRVPAIHLLCTLCSQLCVNVSSFVCLVSFLLLWAYACDVQTEVLFVVFQCIHLHTHVNTEIQILEIHTELGVTCDISIQYSAVLVCFRFVFRVRSTDLPLDAFHNNSRRIQGFW